MKINQICHFCFMKFQPEEVVTKQIKIQITFIVYNKILSNEKKYIYIVYNLLLIHFHQCIYLQHIKFLPI